MSRQSNKDFHNDGRIVKLLECMTKEEVLHYLTGIIKGSDSKPSEKLKSAELMSRLLGWEEVKSAKGGHEKVNFTFAINIGGEKDVNGEIEGEKAIDVLPEFDEDGGKIERRGRPRKLKY